jgi:hypothetical protein
MEIAIAMASALWEGALARTDGMGRLALKRTVKIL